jgi:hypothetical protein
MRSEALGIVVENTGRALVATERERKANEETEKLQNFAKNMTRDVNNMLTRFYSRKRCKEKRYQRLSDEEANALADFANFARVLAVSVSSLLNRLRKNETFEEKLDEEIKQLETYVKKRIKEFDEVLEDALTGRGRMFIKRLAKRVGNVIRGIAKPSRGERLVMKSQDEMERGMSAAFTGEAGHIREPGSAAAGFKTALGEPSANSKTKLELWF